MKTRTGVGSVLLKNTRKCAGTKTDERTADADLRAVVRQLAKIRPWVRAEAHDARALTHA